MALSTVYTQNHYALDSLAGVVWALLAQFGIVPLLGRARTALLPARRQGGNSLPAPRVRLPTRATAGTGPALRPTPEVTLVTGATGFIGRYLVHHLAARGDSVRALVRDPEAASRMLPASVDFVVGDLRRPSSLERAVAGVHTVLHLGALARARCPDLQEFEDVNTNAVDGLLRTARRHDVQRLVHVSTVLTLPPHSPASVNGSSCLPTPYEVTKIAGERLVERYARAGRHAVIVHPTRVYGPGPLHDANGVTKILDLYLRGRFPVRLDDGGAFANYVHAGDVAVGIMLAASHGQSGDHYVLGGNENISLCQFLALASELSGIRRRVFAVPPKPVIGLAAFNEWLGRFGAGVPITPGWIRILLEDRRVSIEPARTALGYRPRPLELGLAETIAWLERSRPREDR